MRTSRLRSLLRRLLAISARCPGSNAGHQQAELFTGGGIPGHDVDQFTVVDHADAVGQAQDFVQLERHQQHGFAFIAQAQQLAVDAFNGADVQTARGLRGNQQFWIAADFARQDHLLLVAAGQIGRFAPQDGRPYVELL